MTQIGRIALSMAALASISTPAAAASEVFVRFGDLRGEVSDPRHDGWTLALSWSRLPSERCPRTDCPLVSTRKLVIRLDPAKTPLAVRQALVAGAMIEEVRLDDYWAEPVGTDYSSVVTVFHGVQIDDVQLSGGVEAVSLSFGSMAEQHSWSEKDFFSLRPAVRSKN